MLELKLVLNEQEIITGCKKYNHKAQKALFERYAPLMRGVCIRYAHFKSDAEDILLEGFIKIFDKIKDFKGTGSFEGWMKRVFINYAIDYYNKNRKHYHQINLTDNDEVMNYTEEEILEINAAGTECNEDTFNATLVDKAGFTHCELLEILNDVPEPFRLVFNLHCIEKYKHEDISELLNISINTSRTRLLRARKIVQQLLHKAYREKIQKTNVKI